MISTISGFVCCIQMLSNVAETTGIPTVQGRRSSEQRNPDPYCETQKVKMKLENDFRHLRVLPVRHCNENTHEAFIIMIKAVFWRGS